MSIGSIIVGLLAITLSGSGTKSASTHKYVAVGVYMDDKIIDDNNKHIVGTWVAEVDLPPDSDTSVVQKAAQEKCALTAPNGWRCAEMRGWDLDKRGWLSKPCAVEALGLYRHFEHGKEWTYTIWDGEAGFATKDDAISWGRKAIRDMATQNSDVLVRTISITTNCRAPGSS